MAMLQGCNAVINSDGNLELRWYKDSDYVLDGHKYYQQGVTFTTSKDFIIQKLTCNNTKSGSTEQSEITSGDGATGLTFANPFMTQEILDEVYKKIGGFAFRPIEVKFVGDYRLEVGDIITVNKAGVDYKVPIMQITHECDGGLMDTITSIGKSDTENTSVASGPVTKQMERYYADLVVINKALINKLDVDTAKITYATITNLNATNASIENLKTNKLDATYADIINANIENLKAVNAEITNLKANSLTADKADLAYAKIDFANVTAQVVGTSIIKDGAVTNEKVQSLSANKLTAGTIDASKIIVTNLNADNITVGRINGKLIGTGSVDLDKLAQEVPTKEYLDKVQEKLQGQIDGNIETFTKTEIPTLNNEPAVNWADDATRKKHIGDICYVVNPASSADGYSYRFADTGTLEAPNYEWVLIKDSDVTKALQDIININGEITGIKKFDVEISSWKTDTDSELSSLKTRTTTLETDMGNKVDTKTFNEVKQTVDGNSSTITKLTETLNTKADGSTVESLANVVNTVKQTADSNSLSISGLYTEQTKLSDAIDRVDTKASDAQDWCQNIEDNLNDNYPKTVFMKNEITQAITKESNSIKEEVSATYATKDSLKNYATSASLELYIKKDPTTGELKSAIEAIADTINITARGGLNISGDRFTLASTNTTITADGTITSKGTGVGSDGNEYSMAATMRGGELKVWNNTSNNGVRIQGHALLGYDDDGTNTIKVVYTPSDEDDMTTGFWLYSNLGQEASITRKQIWLQGNNSDGSIYGYCNIGKGYVRIDSSGKTYYTDCELSVMGTAKINNLNINGSTKFTSDLSAIQIWNQYFGYCQPVTASTNRVTLTWTDSKLEVWVDNTLVGTLFG